MSGPSVARARADADAARAQLNQAVADAKHRLSVSTIAGNMADSVREKTTAVASEGVAIARDAATQGVAIAREAAAQVVPVARDAANQGATIARERPALTGTVAGVITLLVVRKPIVRLGRRLFGRRPPRQVPQVVLATGQQEERIP